MRTNEASLIEPAVAGIFAVSSGRLGSSLAIVLGLIGIVSGARAMTRSTGSAVGATTAMALGLAGLTLGGLVAATADGGTGTGNGLGGAVVAMVLGVIGLVLGGLARARTRGLA